ncbi:MAG: FecR domain-containing protein [Treponema sp.]|nr:FecR domain-containing protein [Treponema sp.]
MKNRNRFFALLIVLMCFASNAFSAPAIVSYVRGKVEVCRGEKWLQLKIGDKINPSETISTGFQSEVKIKYNDSLMVLGALTRITLDEFSETENKDTVSAYLSTGAVRSKVIHTESKRVSYTVKSPVAVASVRGTDFIVTSAGAISCNEGAVAVYANTEKRRMASNSSTPVKSENSEEAEDLPSGSNDSATATTPASEISADAPVGAVVVAVNQQVNVMKNGLIDNPADNLDRKKSSIINSVSAPLTAETVSFGTSSANQAKTSINDIPPVIQNTEINITVKLSE